jgi:SAM-dependent methyltransferase
MIPQNARAGLLLALAAAEVVGPRGKVWGVDPNPAMLAVARLKPAAVEWLEAAAEALPLEDDVADAAFSQFAMMFFEDRPAAFREMARVTRPGGPIRVAVCAAHEASPGYRAFADLIGRLFGAETREGFARPFALGDAATLARDAAAGGLDAEVEAWRGEVRFASIADLVSTERACVWTLGGLLDEEQFARLTAESEAAMAPWRAADGACVFEMPALVVSARAP